MFAFQLCLKLHHRQLDDVGTRTLDRSIGRGPKLLRFHPAASCYFQIDLEWIHAAEAAEPIAVEVERTPASQNGFHIALTEGKTFLKFKESEHLGIALFVFA